MMMVQQWCACGARSASNSINEMTSCDLEAKGEEPLDASVTPLLDGLLASNCKTLDVSLSGLSFPWANWIQHYRMVHVYHTVQ